MSGNMSVSKSMRSETSDDYSLFFQAGLLSICFLVVAREDGLLGGLAGGVNEVKGRSLTEFNGDNVEGLQ